MKNNIIKNINRKKHAKTHILKNKITDRVLMWKLMVGMAAFAFVLSGCGNVDRPDSSSVPTATAEEHPKGTPMPTATPEVVQPPGVTPAPTATPEVIVHPEGTIMPTAAPTATPEPTAAPTATPAPTETPDPNYPLLKADGVGWGLFHFGQGVQPRGNEKVDVLEKYRAYFVGNANDKVLYLTFDCGYENGNTEPILDALKEHEVKATFFVTGHYVKTEKDLLKRMIEDGHTVGNHSYNHPDISQLERETLQRELDLVRDKFKEQTGADLSMYFRPPLGMCSSRAMKWSKEMGYATIFWSSAYRDWDAENQPTHEEALQTLVERTHPGAIVLLHNTSQTNGEILGELITKWKEMGYEIKPLSELTGM